MDIRTLVISNKKTLHISKKVMTRLWYLIQNFVIFFKAPPSELPKYFNPLTLWTSKKFRYPPLFPPRPSIKDDIRNCWSDLGVSADVLRIVDFRILCLSVNTLKMLIVPNIILFVKNRPAEEKQTSQAQRREESDVEMTSESETSGDQSDRTA
jgi:hypothetical protein